jgi:tetratricopeptide (TPR) repeat protein
MLRRLTIQLGAACCGGAQSQHVLATNVLAAAKANSAAADALGITGSQVHDDLVALDSRLRRRLTTDAAKWCSSLLLNREDCSTTPFSKEETDAAVALLATDAPEPQNGFRALARLGTRPHLVPFYEIAEAEWAQRAPGLAVSVKFNRAAALRDRGDLSEALAVLNDVEHAVASRHDGSTPSADIANLQLEKARLHRRIGGSTHLQSAIALYGTVLQTSTRHGDTTARMPNAHAVRLHLAGTLAQLGGADALQRAELLFKEVLDSYTTADDDRVLSATIALADVLVAQRKYHEAGKVLEALERRHIEIAGLAADASKSLRLARVAALRAERSGPSLTAATALLQVLEDSLRAQQQVGSASPADVAAVMAKRADVLCDHAAEGALRRAVVLYEAAEAMVSGSPQPEHADMATALALTRAGVLRGLGEVWRAIDIYDRALPAIVARRGAGHHDVAMLRMNMGNATVELSNPSVLPAAIEHFEAAERALRLALGAAHPHVASARLGMAECLVRLDGGENLTRAEGLAEQAAAILERFKHPDANRVWLLCADVKLRLGGVERTRSAFTIVAKIPIDVVDDSLRPRLTALQARLDTLSD